MSESKYNQYEIHIQVRGFPAILLREADHVEVGGSDAKMSLSGHIEVDKKGSYHTEGKVVRIPPYAVGWEVGKKECWKKNKVLWVIPDVIAVYKSKERSMSSIPIGTWSHDMELMWRSRYHYTIENTDR